MVSQSISRPGPLFHSEVPSAAMQRVIELAGKPVNRVIPQLAINCKTAWTLGANGGELIRWAELSRNGRANRSGIGGGFLRSECSVTRGDPVQELIRSD